MEVRERSRLVPLLIYVGGPALMFLGERVFSSINAARMTLSLAGFGLALAYLVLRIKGFGSETGERTGLWVCPRCKTKIISRGEWPTTLKPSA